MKRLITLWLGLAAFALPPVFAQTYATLPKGKVHGHITNPSGAPETGGTVTFEGTHATAMPNAKNNEAAILNVDSTGSYSGDVPAGTFRAVYREQGVAQSQMTDKLEDVKVVADQDTTVDFDMTRKAYLDTLSADDRKRAEELRGKNKEAIAANEVIKNLNNDLKQVTQDIKDADGAHQAAVAALGATASADEVTAKENEIKTAKFTDVVTLMTRDTSAKADASVLWVQLGQGQLGLKKYDDAQTSFQKAIDLEGKAAKPNPQIQGMAQSGLGEVLARSSKIPDAQAAYDVAAKVNPTQAGFYYKNEAVVFMQTGNADAQAAAADAGIKVDPNQAILYYLKGNALVSKATIDQASGKMVFPDGCLDAYQKYLDLAPTGQYVNDVKGILAEAQQTHNTSYGQQTPTKKKK